MKFVKIIATTFTIAMLAIGISSECNAKAYGSVEHPIADFENQISQGIVILDFFATWCPPCRRFSPVFEKAAANHTDILFIKIDVDKHENLVTEYGVRSMPTIIVLKDGVVVKTKTGYMSSKQFDKWISSI